MIAKVQFPRCIKYPVHKVTLVDTGSYFSTCENYKLNISLLCSAKKTEEKSWGGCFPGKQSRAFPDLPRFTAAPQGLSGAKALVDIARTGRGRTGVVQAAHLFVVLGEVRLGG